MKPEQTRKKLLIVIASTIFGAAIVFMLVLVLSRIGKVEVTVNLSPADANFTINGKPAKAGTVYLSKGKHTLKATREHFEDAVVKIDTATLSSRIIYVLAAAKNEASEQYLLDHPDEVAIRENAGSAESNERLDNMLKRYPVTAALPHQTLDYKIDYVLEENQEVTFKVKLYPVATAYGTPQRKAQLEELKASAFKWLKDHKLNTSKATIVVTPDPKEQPTDVDPNATE